MSRRKKQKTIEEYIESINKLSEQAKIDEKRFVRDFLSELVKNSSADEELFDFIYKTADDLTDELAKMYSELLANEAPIEWYYCMGNINDERENPEGYFKIVYQCFAENIALDEVQDILNESNSFSEFNDKINSLQAAEIQRIHDILLEKQGLNESGAYTMHLEKENAALSVRIDFLLNEVHEAREDAKSLREDVFSHRYDLLKCQEELEKERRSSSRAVLSEKLSTGKLTTIQAIIKLLESENEGLRIENENLNLELEDTKDEWRNMKNRCEELEKLLAEKQLQIEALKDSLDGYTVGKDNVYLQEEINSELVDTPIFNEVEEDEFTDYSIGTDIFEDIVEIKDNRKQTIKHTNLFATILSKYYEKKFEKKTLAEQDNLIFIKMMEKRFTKEMVQLVKKAMAANSSLSRTKLYMIILRNATMDELVEFCEASV